MTTLEWQTAQVRCNSFGEWKLRVFGTDIYESVFRYRHPTLEPFPGRVLNDRLADLGWHPDRRQLAPAASSRVERELLTMRAGWSPKAFEDGVWVIPVYREKGCYADGRTSNTSKVAAGSSLKS